MAAPLKLEIFTRVYGASQHQDRTVVAFPRPVLPLYEVIALKVRAEIERAARQRTAEGPLPLSLRYLTEEDVAWLRGGVAKLPDEPRVNVQLEVEKALSAFAKRRYFVLLDGTRLSDLEEMVELNPESKLQFIRLLPLVGGRC